jgi:hypothetical protein
VTYTLGLLALAAVFVIRALRVRAQRQRERTSTQDQLKPGEPGSAELDFVGPRAVRA